MFRAIEPASWLPAGKRAAVCFTIDDVHPGKFSDPYEAGGELGKGALGHVERLLERHPQLCVTLFTTADWREISPLPTRKLLKRIPLLRDRLMLAKIHPEGTMRLDRHAAFVRYVRELPRTEVALHGLWHVHKGPTLHVEFQEQDEAACTETLAKALGIFERAGLSKPRGMSPPGWDAPPGLLGAMRRLGFLYVASSRDIRGAIERDARAEMSGLKGTSLLFPERIGGGAEALVHFSTNFQATSGIERAVRILELGGVLAIKGHIVKNAMGFVMLDGIDGVYANYLDLLFRVLANRFGDSIWWTTMGDLAERIHAVKAPSLEESRAAG